MIPDPYETKMAAIPVQFASFADYEVEIELIGSILKRGELLDEIGITADTMHSTTCQDIYNAMVKVREHGLVLDVVTVGDQLDRDGLLASIRQDVFTGRAALSKIRERGNPKNVISYVEIVKDYWAKRRIDEISQTLVVQSRNGRRAVDILADARVKFDDLDMSNGKVSSKTYNARSMASILYDHAESASKGQLKGCKTGFTELDKLVTLMAGDLALVAGRPGQGKSALLLSVASLVAKHKKRVGIFSLEMTTKQVTARMASHISGIATDKILKGNMSAEEWTMFNHAIETIEHLPIAINDQAGLTIHQMRAETRRMMKELGGLDLIILDYAQLMKSVSKRLKNRNEEIGEITKGLKEIGKEFDVPILAAAQMSRAVEQRAEKRPVLSDLRESGDLENDADIVMFIYQPSEADKTGQRELIIAKHRNGPVGLIDLTFIGAQAKFESCSTRVFSTERGNL